MIRKNFDVTSYLRLLITAAP